MMQFACQGLMPTFRPLLPAFDLLRPFLEEIDRHRWYSNFGPLTRRFEGQIAATIGTEPDRIVTVANATLGLTLALLDAARGDAGLCVMPAWTFAATPIAARGAGLEPYFVDVDAHSWQIDPDRVSELAASMPGRVKAVVPVAPFGEVLDYEAWARFARTTGIEVVVDAASAFDSVAAKNSLVSVVSLHATKVLGVGDGGFIVAASPAGAERLRRMSNFGFSSDRLSVMPGLNAKMSEYSAAIGLAALADWGRARATFIAKGVDLAALLSPSNSVTARARGDFASSTFNVVTAGNDAEALVDWLRAQGLEARKWWADGCHRHPAFAEAPRADLSVTEELAGRVVALPFWVDMSASDMAVVADCVRRFRA